MTMTIAVDGYEVSVTVNEPGATQIATSLQIPLTAVSSAETGSTLTLYAATPGAFVDLAADLGYAHSLWITRPWSSMTTSHRPPDRA